MKPLSFTIRSQAYPRRRMRFRCRVSLLFTFTLLLSLPAALRAQTAEDSVKATINRLFESFRNADAALFRSVFTDSAIIQTIAHDRQTGRQVIRTEALSVFADFVGKQAKGAADERITFETVKTDGPLAVAWTPYRFYFNGAFSHCGVNSFQLVRTGGAWKIQYLIDTRRKRGCE